MTTERGREKRRQGKGGVHGEGWKREEGDGEGERGDRGIHGGTEERRDVYENYNVGMHRLITSVGAFNFFFNVDNLSASARTTMSGKSDFHVKTARFRKLQCSWVFQGRPQTSSLMVLMKLVVCTTTRSSLNPYSFSARVASWVQRCDLLCKRGSLGPVLRPFLQKSSRASKRTWQTW